MIPAGSIDQTDTSKREISQKKDWTYEFQRPIYFLRTRESLSEAGANWTETQNG
jgi:hypothetical protein